jgi:hypothetical protein
MCKSKEAFNAALQITLANISARQNVSVDEVGAKNVVEFFEIVFNKLDTIMQTTNPNQK